MPAIDITADQHDRLMELCDELADAHADSYTSVTVPDMMAYLLDLAEAVDDPGRRVDLETGADTPHTNHEFPRTELEATLGERNRRHTDSSADSPMDLYTIAAEYDITGRSNMNKQELITAISDTVERRYTDPLAATDLSLAGIDAASSDTCADETASETPAASETHSDDTPETPTAEDDGTSDDEQLNTMLNLLETHQDKWREANGDARYEVDLPDGSVEQVRTKDDVRAVIFKHY